MPCPALRVLLGLGLLLLGAGGTRAAAGQGETSRPPNVVFFLADDLGWRDTGVYGSTFHETPNVDRLAARGMRFTNAYAANPLCSPTRSSILTGKFPARLRFTTPAGHLKEVVLDPVVPERGNPAQPAVTPQTRTRLPLEEYTLAEALRDAGYATAHYGKWHLGWEPYDAGAQGFQHVVPGGSYPGPPGTYFSPFRAPIFPDAPPGRHIDELCTDDAVTWIKEHKDQPFFLNYWFFSVHAPHDGATAQQRAHFAAKADPDHPQRNPIYAGMVANMDTALGRILDTLDELGLSDNTIIIFTADNGGISWQDVEGAPVTSNAPLRNGKASIYEGGTREPAIAVWPQHIAAGVVNETPIMSIDYYPTLLDLLDIEPSKDQPFDGLSIAPELTGTGSIDREQLFCHFPHYTPASGNLPSTWVRQGPWKLIRFYADGPDQTNRFELYNLDQDISEEHDLAAQEPERVAMLDHLISQFLADTAALIPKPNPAYQKADRAWKQGNDATLAVEGDVLAITSKGPDPFVISPALQVPRGPYTLSFEIRSDSQGEGRVYWGERRLGFALERSAPFGSAHDQQWHAVSVAIPSEAAITSLRIDPATAPGAIQLRSIVLRNSEGMPLQNWPEAQDR